jgi:apolipoprotein N-acyltransferase
MWVAFVPAVVAQHRVLPRRLSALGIAVAIGVYVEGYLGPLIAAIGDVPAYEKPIGLYAALLALAFSWRSRDFHERTSYRWFVLAAPVTWAAFDFIRTLLPIEAGATGGYLANSFYDRPSLVQPISVLTLHALNLLVMVVNWTIALAVIVLIDRRRPAGSAVAAMRSTKVQIAVVLVIVVAWVGASLSMLASPAPNLRVAAVMTPGFGADQIPANVAYTREAAARGAKLVVWHEAMLPFDPASAQGADLRRLADELDIYLVLGWGTHDAGVDKNISTVIDPDGHVMGSYGKLHPVTVLGEHSDVHGMFPRMDTSFGRLGTIICADLDFTDVARHWSSLGAQVLAVPSNDVGTTEHYTRVVLRAVENRVAMVKADGGWDSAIVDPYGRITQLVVPAHRGPAMIVGDVPVGSGRTIASRIGNGVGWLLVAGVVVFLALGVRVRRRSAAR